MPSADHELGPQNLRSPSRTVTREPSGRSPEHAEPSRFLPHVQGLRAIAVLLVVLYHFWPGRLSGGYVGVDVFFVISGFLITGHLMRELEATGGVRLAQFWARRARRLLPASLLVLLFCALVVGTPYLFPLSSLPTEIREILASTFYVENWFLALNSADYLADTGEPTTVQHYWSLSLEEQFYVLWPLILLAAAWIGVTRFRGARRRAVLVAIVAVTAASFVFNVIFTITDPAPAYFVTFGRMWQFGVGALIALVPMLQIRHAVGSFLLGWAGIAALVFTAFTFDAQTPFPGYMAAIPTLGAAAVIAASNADRWWYPTRVLSLRPARFVGDISYSLYLWHWPLIVIAPSVPFWGLSIYHRVALLALCFVLAWLTKRFVEDPARSWKVLTSRRPRVTLWSSLVAMVVVAAVAAGAWAVNAPAYRTGVQAIEQTRENPPECFGAASVLDPACATVDFGDQVLPAPGFAAADRPSDEQCFVQLNDTRPVTCEFGVDDPEAPEVVLIGDSHAFQLLSTFESIAVENGWRLTTLFKGACPWSTTSLVTPGAFGAACDRWRQNAAEVLEERDPDVIFTAALSTTPYSSAGFDSAHDAAVAGYRDAWRGAIDRGIPVVTVVDNPVWENDPNKCLRTRGIDACAGARDAVLSENDPVRDAAEGMSGVTLLDFTDVYCDDAQCSPVVGGANVYRDEDHLTVTFADTLAPSYAAALRGAMGRDGSLTQ
ncbi:acyltransferase family protein [Microbacterium limosum]|uniref:Acyltransferase family protein n=1 Tax=Microbacterium limosum TaxID=3079935 RepID=A0AAU0MKB9_9MICO|nr:acyltransferase family protein [Microbacterium sp. Y20]WOQ70602.1 acyltransferase family protein [Microbacterium sp. Y20]